MDLSGANAAAANANTSTSSPSAVVKGVAINTTSNESSSELSSPVSALKDKERLAEKVRELGLDFFSEDFEGVTVSTTKCLSCETVTEQKESMIDIAVPVPISGYDLTDYTDKPSAFIQVGKITIFRIFLSTNRLIIFYFYTEFLRDARVFPWREQISL